MYGGAYLWGCKKFLPKFDLVPQIRYKQQLLKLRLKVPLQTMQGVSTANYQFLKPYALNQQSIFCIDTCEQL